MDYSIVAALLSGIAGVAVVQILMSVFIWIPVRRKAEDAAFIEGAKIGFLANNALRSKLFVLGAKRGALVIRRGASKVDAWLDLESPLPSVLDVTGQAETVVKADNRGSYPEMEVKPHDPRHS